MKTELTVVYLTDEQAKMMVDIEKRFAFLKLLESVKAFDIRSGSITINFDSMGTITSLDKKEHFSAK